MTNKDSVHKLVRAYNNKKDVLRNMKDEISTLSRRLKPMDIDYDKRTRLILEKEKLEKDLRIGKNVMLGMEESLEIISGADTDIQNMTIDEAINIIDGLTLDEFFDHRTAEFVLGKAVHDMSIRYYGTEYYLIEELAVPDYIGEWIQSNRNDSSDDIHDVLEGLLHSDGDKTVSQWVFKDEVNLNTFALVWLTSSRGINSNRSSDRGLN